MKRFLLAVLFSASAFTLNAQPWQMVGPRAMGMGGAGVATAYGADAQYWNPAALKDTDQEMQNVLLNVGLQMETTKDVMNALDNLNDLSDRYKNLSDKISYGGAPNAQDISTLFEGLSDISDLTKNNLGAVVGADAGLGIKIKNFAVSVRSLGTMGVTPVIDTVNVGLGNQGGTAGLNISDNTALPAETDSLRAAQILAQTITDTNTLDAINTLLQTNYASAADMANAFINTALGAGSSAQEVLSAAQTAASNLPNAADIIQTAAQHNGGNGYEQNESRAMADLGLFSEIALGYAQEVIPGLQVGGNLKLIEGTIAQTGILVLQDDKSLSDVASDAWDNKKTSAQLGVDLGAKVNLSRLTDREILFNPVIGLTARNINSPKFDRPGLPQGIPDAIAQSWQTGDYKLKPQIRAGIAIEPLRTLVLAADLDLTENETAIANFKSRQLAIGAEWDFAKGKTFSLPLRAGINKNLAESDSSMYYTLGLGFKIARFQMELAGAISSETAEVEGADVPASAGASFSLGFVF